MYLNGILAKLEGMRDILGEAAPGGGLSPESVNKLNLLLDGAAAEGASLSGRLIDVRDYCDSYNLPLCITDANGLITYMNEQYVGQTKLSPEEALGKPEPFNNPISARVIRERKTVSFGNDGVRLGLNSGRFVAGIPIFDENGELRHVVITLSTQDVVMYRYQELRRIMNLKESVRMLEGGLGDEFETLLGNNREIEAIRKLIRKTAATDATVLITGESGTGKEVAADCIYNLSRRKGKPYVKINCAAIPANLIEAELFGYEPGAFTGASSKGKAGLLEMANHGTVLLDEIGDFPVELQPKLLRVLQHGEMYKVGGSTPTKLDIRLIAATNSDLKKKIELGSFREDLYYRLSVIPLYMPPLRERKEDVRGLVRHFVHVYSEKYGRKLPVAPEIMRVLENYDWPGNVRELQNIVEYFVIVSDEQSVLSAEELEMVIASRSRQTCPEGGGTLIEKRDRYEKRLIEEAIKTSPSLRRAAEKLGIFPSSLYRKLQKYQIPYDDRENQM